MNSTLFARRFARMMALLSIILSACTQADCHIDHTQVMRFHLPDITLSGTEHAGTILAQESRELGDKLKSSSLSCNAGGNLWAFTTHRTVMGNHTFATNVPGVGYRLFINDRPFPFKIATHCDSVSCYPQGADNAHIKLQLVQTAAHISAAGQVMGGTYGTIRPDTGKPALLINLLNSITLQRAACNPVVNTVDLGVAEATDFPSLFSASHRITFRLNTNCPLDIPFKARWEGHTDNRGLLRPLTGKRQAGGIRIRLRDSAGSPVSFGHTFEINHNIEKETFSAEMVRTGDITPGEINALATLHLLYQ